MVSPPLSHAFVSLPLESNPWLGLKIKLKKFFTLANFTKNISWNNFLLALSGFLVMLSFKVGFMHFIYDHINAYVLACLSTIPFNFGIKGFIDSALENGLRPVLNNYLESSFNTITKLMGKGKFKLPLHHFSGIEPSSYPPAQAPAPPVQAAAPPVQAPPVQAPAPPVPPSTVYDPVRDIRFQDGWAIKDGIYHIQGQPFYNSTIGISNQPGARRIADALEDMRNQSGYGPRASVLVSLKEYSSPSMHKWLDDYRIHRTNINAGQFVASNGLINTIRNLP